MKDLMRLKNAARLAVALTVLLAGCSSDSKETAETLTAFANACNKPVSAELTHGTWSTSIVVRCDEMKPDDKDS